MDTINELRIKSDNEVIETILEGDVSAFETLIRRYNSVLYKIARSFGYNHQDAEDLMQDTHITAYTQLSKFQGRASYKTWVSRIMINKCLYKLKYGYTSREISSDNLLHYTTLPMHEKDNRKTENVVHNHELALILEKSLSSIPVIYRTVFVLREVEGFSIQETAELLNISPVNVKVRLNRAKALLQKQIEQYYSSRDLYSFNLIYCDGIVERVLRKIQETSEK